MTRHQVRPSQAFGAFAAALAAVLLVFGCTGKPNDPAQPGDPMTPGETPMSTGGNAKVIKIVSSLPRTGSAKTQTDTIVNGIRLAVDEVGGQVGEYTIQYLDWDDATAAAGAWTAEAETTNAQKAAADPDVMVYIGPFNSGAAKISMPILNKAGVLMISPSNTWPGLTKPGLGDPGEPEIYRPSGKINYTRVVPADDLQGVLAADWCQQLGVKKVYILDDNEVYGRGIAGLFEERCRQLEIEVLGRDSIDVKATEFKSLMTKIKATNPDLVYFGGTTQTKGAQVAKDLVASGMTAKLMVPDGCNETAFIEGAGQENLNDRCYVTFGGLPPDELAKKEEGRKFVELYKAKFGTEPDEAYAVYGYECGKVAIEAIRVGGKDRAKIIAAALAIKDMKGALGTWSFDENGDTTMTILSGNIVTGGRFKFVRLLGEAAMP